MQETHTIVSLIPLWKIQSLHSSHTFQHLLPPLNVNESKSAAVTVAEAKSIISAQHCVMETQGSGEINRLAATENTSAI